MKRRDFITLVGNAATWPLAAQAQQTKLPTLGFLNSRSPETTTHLVAAFQRGLKDIGYVDGQNLTIDYRWALGRYDRLEVLAGELARKAVAVIVTSGGEPAAL